MTRWLLLDEYTDDDVVVGVCHDIEGLFADPEPVPPPETFTLLGCDPAGPLREAMDGIGTERAWLAGVELVPRLRIDSRELMDVTVVAQRPSAAGAGLVDLTLRGYVRPTPEDEPLEETGFRLLSPDDEVLGTCVDVAGAFQRPAAPVRPATLIGLRLEDAQGVREGSMITASVMPVHRDGSVAGKAALLWATVLAVRPSRLGGDLIDVACSGGVVDPLPTAAREIFDVRYDGGPVEPNLWARYDRLLQHTWSGVALGHHRDVPDRPAGTTYHLDGRFVTDIDAFYCALGEAINGPGGYFGWNLAAPRDCLSGRWGAANPFHLVWHHSRVARRHLVGYDRPAHRLRSWRPAVTVDALLRLFAEAGITVSCPDDRPDR